MYSPAAVRTLFRRFAPPAAPPRWAGLVEAVAVAGYLAALGVALGRLAAARMFWFDELFTLHLARFRSPAELWHHLAVGADNNPPLVYLLTAAAVAVFGEAEWAVRLPAVLGAVAAGLCLYLFVRRRRGAAEALLAMAAVGPTAPVWIYFLEARPYGLAVGFTALALLCWQRAAEAADTGGRRRGWLAGFAAAAGLGMASHYYFVVPLAGLAVAELVRTVARRRLDRSVLAGFAAGGLMLAALYPLWGFGPKSYAPGFWAKVKLTRAAVEDAFQGMYSKELTVPVALALVVGVVAGGRKNPAPTPAARGEQLSLAPPLPLGEGAGGRGEISPVREPQRLTPNPSPRRGEGDRPSYPVWEAVALAALAAGPALGVAVGAKLVGAYYYRYTLPAAVGLAGVLAYAVGRGGGGTKWGCVVAAAGFAVTGAAGQWTAAPGSFRAEAREVRATLDFLDAHSAGGAVVMDSPFEFARAWHYGGGRRFTPAFLADPAAALKYTRADTVDRGVQALARVAAVPVVGSGEVADRVTAGEPTYYFGPRLDDGIDRLTADQSTPSPVPRAEWRADELRARGVRFEPVARRANGTLYRLTR